MYGIKTKSNGGRRWPLAGRREGQSLYDAMVWAMLIWCVFQDLVLGALYHATGFVLLAKVLLHAKDALLVLLFLLAIQRVRVPSPVFYAGVTYLALIAVQLSYSLAASGMGTVALLASARGLVLLPALGLIGYAVEDKERFLLGLMHRYFPFLVAIAFFGLIEYCADYVIGTKSFWVNVIGIGSYLTDVKGQINGVTQDLPGNFYTYSLSGASFAQKRLVSVWGGPLTSGYVLLLPLVYYAWSIFGNRDLQGPKKAHLLFFLVLFVALALTFTRAVIIMAVIAVLCLVVRRYRRERYLMLFLALVIAMLLFPLYQDFALSYLHNGSTDGHIQSVSNSITQITLLGDGVGAFGSHLDTNSVGTESAFLSVCGQLGFAGIALYLYLYIAPLLGILQGKHYRKCLKHIVATTVIAGAVYFFTGMISEQLSAFTTIAQYYVLVGFVAGLCNSSAARVVNYGSVGFAKNYGEVSKGRLSTTQRSAR